MQTNLEQVTEMIRTLPIEDLGKLREVISEEEQAKCEKQKQLQVDIERYKKTDKWLAENREKYMNQWVCLDGDKLIAHGEDGRKVYQQAKEIGIKVPFMHHIVEESDWGGW